MKSEHSERATMRLSEAIRLGAMLGPQTRGAFFQQWGGETATCALGAAADAAGEKDKVLFSLWLTWPMLSAPVLEQELPSELRTGSRRAPLQTLSWTIMALNDIAGWTRTQIADWVAEFENRHANEYNDHRPASDPDPASSDEPEEGIMVLSAR